MNTNIVIIGGVACGPKAAARIKRLNPKACVTLVEKGELLSYAGCGLPFYISGEVTNYNELMATPAGVVRDTHFFKEVKDINVFNHTVAREIDRKNKVVKALRLDTGEAVSFPYDHLVLAVGSHSTVPPVEGIDLNGVHFLQTVEDARKIRNESGDLKGKKAVIIGAGLIGLEVTESFERQGMNITMIEKTGSVMGGLLDPEISFHIHRELEDNDVDLRLNESVVKIISDGAGNLKSVVTDRGEYEADMVLVSIGVRPNIQLAVDAGLAIGKTGAIRVNDRLQTSDPFIYAGGDCVESTNLVSQKPLYAPLGSTANKHGRIIADNICGRQTTFRGVCGTAICKLFDINVARTGLTEDAARDLGYDVITVLNPSPDKAHFLSSAKMIIIKFIVDRATEKLLGCQIVGPGDVAKRMEIAVATISSNATVRDIGHFDLAYAPPYSPAMDNIIVAANIAQNKLDSLCCSYTPYEVMEKIEKNEDFIFLDVRSPIEFKQMRIEDPRIKLIPLGKLRESLSELPKGKEIIPFCKLSLRGYEAERILEGQGYENVRFMDGGLACWPFEISY
jgi:NADPH-dependent 2,4-dienoyl-CoA reductase/sulfur reductase-like enzyme/rhodanese-related sulfurtransferase